MMQTPRVVALRYDPYARSLSWEGYDLGETHRLRRGAIAAARDAKRWGVVLGTLGRQGNPAILGHVRRALRERGREHFVLLLSEVFPDKLRRFAEVDAWVQIACPRLSVDWGAAFEKPVLNAYEFEVAMGATPWREDHYPMDFYKRGSGPWTNFGHATRALG